MKTTKTNRATYNRLRCLQSMLENETKVEAYTAEVIANAENYDTWAERNERLAITSPNSFSLTSRGESLIIGKQAGKHGWLAGSVENPA